MKGTHMFHTLGRAAVAVVLGGAAVACQPTASDETAEQAPAAAPERAHFTKLPGDVTWLDPPKQAGFLPEGVRIALIEGGSPLDKGPFTFRLRFPAGSRLMPHTHPVTDRITVLSGTLNQGTGKTFDKAQTEPVPAGGFVYHPSDDPHFVWFDEETILQFHGDGPFGLTYVNPADDPRNQK